MTERSRLAASPGELHFGDKTLRMRPLTDRDIGELDGWLRQRIIRSARESLPPGSTQAEREETLSLAMREAATASLISPYGVRVMSTPEGLARLVWQSVRLDHPEQTPESILALLYSPENIRAANEAFMELNSVPESKNPEAPQQPTA